jgi:hypothetical protein
MQPLQRLAQCHAQCHRTSESSKVLLEAWLDQQQQHSPTKQLVKQLVKPSMQAGPWQPQLSHAQHVRTMLHTAVGSIEVSPGIQLHEQYGGVNTINADRNMAGATGTHAWRATGGDVSCKGNPVQGPSSTQQLNQHSRAHHKVTAQDAGRLVPPEGQMAGQDAASTTHSTANSCMHHDGVDTIPEVLKSCARR